MDLKTFNKAVKLIVREADVSEHDAIVLVAQSIIRTAEKRS